MPVGPLSAAILIGVTAAAGSSAAGASGAGGSVAGGSTTGEQPANNPRLRRKIIIIVRSIYFDLDKLRKDLNVIMHRLLFLPETGCS
jgi:hypothetical protein